MTASRTVLQTLIDEFGKACAAHDTERVLWCRRTLDARITELFEAANGGTRRTPPPFPPTQPKKPPRPFPPPRPPRKEDLI